jgi:hypothetical protein
MGQLYSYSPNRYIHESSYASHTQNANNFGHVKIQIYIYIYNMQIIYPIAMILLGMANIKTCFCFGRIHVDLTEAFWFHG